MKTLSLLNMKGGVGKTTLAVNLAAYLHQTGNNVLLVDLDPQFNASQYLLDFSTFQKQRKAGHTTAGLLIEQPKLALKAKPKPIDPKKRALNAVLNLKTKGGKNLDILPSELELAWVVKNPAQMDYKLEKLLEYLRPNYDYIIIDCAPTDSVLTTMALTASDFILVPMRPDRFSILGFANLMECVDTFRKNSPDTHKVKVAGIVFTQVTNGSQVEEQSMQEVSDAAQKQKVYLFSNHLGWSNSFQRSIKDQTPIFETQYANAKVRSMAGKIGNELVSQMEQLAAKAKKGIT